MRCPALSLALSVILAVCPLTPRTATAAQSNGVPGQFVLQDGTPIRLRFNHNVSSADATVGQSVDLEVLEEVVVNGVAVVPKTGTALATVTEAEPKRTMGRAGKLEIVLDFVRLADNEKAPIRAVKEGKGGSHTAGMTIGIVATSLVFWPAAPLLLFIHGKDITIPKGAEVIGYVNGDMKLNPANFSHAAEPTSPIAPTNSLAVMPAATHSDSGMNQSAAPMSQAQSSSSSAVTVNSTPPGADIFVDDDFSGNTPSTLNLSVGKHVVAVRKAGFQAWVRTLSLSGGSITLNAELTRGADEMHTAIPVTVPVSKSEATATGPLASSSPKAVGWIGIHAKNKGDAAVVTNVNPDSPGAKAGIQVGDIILALDGRMIKGRDFESFVSSLKPGLEISVNYARGSSAHEVWLTVSSQN
jgi:PDZ domain/PEGA domain